MPGEIRAVAETSLRIFAFALGPNYLLIITNYIFRAAGDVKKPLLTMFCVSLVNIAGDFALVFGIPPFPEMGYRGIALATASSLAAGMLISLALLATKRWRGVFTQPWRVDFPTIGRIVAWLASVFLQIAWQAGDVLYNFWRGSGRARSRALPPDQRASDRASSSAALPSTCRSVSRADLGGATEEAETLGETRGGTGPARFAATAIFVWAEAFASILARTPEVLDETANYLRINMVSEPFLALGTILSGAITGAGDTKSTMWIIVASMWGVRLPLAYGLAITLDWGPTGVWVAMVVSMMFYSLLMALRFRGGRWKHVRVDALVPVSPAGRNVLK
jgi:Na+-driven multidrug efflux pump